MGWTTRSVGVSLLLAMEAHRKAAGLRVVRLREARGWTQEDLAHVAELSVKTISRFENGRHDGRRTTVEKIADALGVAKTEIEGEPPAPLGLNSNGDGPLDEILTMLRSLDARLERLEAELLPSAQERALAAAESTRARAQLRAGRRDRPDPPPDTPDR